MNNNKIILIMKMMAIKSTHNKIADNDRNKKCFIEIKYLTANGVVLTSMMNSR